MLFDRPFVCEKLALSRWQSYAMFPATRTGMIREADVLQFVNVGRSKNQPSFAHVPALVTADDLSELTGVPVRKLMLWTRRKRNPIPHVKFNSHVVRFHETEASEWLDKNSR